MNLEFNIAVHVLCFLAQHDQEQFNSKELAKLTCLNPVQLRRVLAYLTEHNYIKVQRGKSRRLPSQSTYCSSRFSQVISTLCFR